MKLLAVDTSTISGSVALLDGGRVRAEWTIHSSETHNRRLMLTIDMLLRELKWNMHDIEGFAVTAGPGSFTGLRIGMTTVKTFAWTLGKPDVALPSLDVLSAPFAFSTMPVCAMIDARKSEVFSAFYEPDGRGNIRQASPYRVTSPENISGMVKGPTLFCGDGWLLYAECLKKRIGSFAFEAPAYLHSIRASVLGELAHSRFIAGEYDDPVKSVPLYIRPSEAELNRNRNL